MLCAARCGPYLNIFRAVIPPLRGTLDLLLILVPNALTSTAVAIPAELSNSSASSQQGQIGASASMCLALLDITANQQKWMRRCSQEKCRATMALARFVLLQMSFCSYVSRGNYLTVIEVSVSQYMIMSRQLQMHGTT
jgi:hypothetical protein